MKLLDLYKILHLRAIQSRLGSVLHFFISFLNSASWEAIITCPLLWSLCFRKAIECSIAILKNDLTVFAIVIEDSLTRLALFKPIARLPMGWAILWKRLLHALEEIYNKLLDNSIFISNKTGILLTTWKWWEGGKFQASIVLLYAFFFELESRAPPFFSIAATRGHFFICGFTHSSHSFQQ